MSKAETNRAILRAWRDAARIISANPQHGRLGAWREAQRLRSQAHIADVTGKGSRRERVYLRALAAAADAAFGL